MILDVYQLSAGDKYLPYNVHLSGSCFSYSRYNGMPLGCSDDKFPWGKNTESEIDNKLLYGKWQFAYSYL